MHKFVRRIMRGVIFCCLTIVIAACAGITDVGNSEQQSQQPTLVSDSGLPRIDVIRLRVARNAMTNGDFNTAIRFFEAVRNSSPSHPAPLVGIANAHMAAGNHKEAILAYREVLDLQSDNDDALDGIARALVLTGDYPEAIKFFNRSLAKAPSAKLHNRLGVAHDLMGDGDGAQRHYRAALQLDPEAISPRNNLALSLAISESYEEAIKEIERVTAHPQATDKHRQNMAFIYGMAGENDEALAGLSEANLSPAEIARNRVLYKRIRAHARAGNRAAILDYLRNGGEIGDPTIADHLSEPAYPENSMASATPDYDLNPSENAGMAPEPLMKKPESSSRSMMKPTRLTKRAKPRKLSRMKADPGVMKRMGDAIYRVQLAAYRTSRTAIRGVKVLHSILKQATPDMNVLVKKIRSENKRGIDYRIRTPQVSSHKAADELCTKIRQGGHPDCLVILHNPRIWAGVDVPDSVKFASIGPAPVSFPGSKHASYRVQLGSYKTEEKAEKDLAVLKKLLESRSTNPSILARRFQRQGALPFKFQIRTDPVKSFSEGTELCTHLKKAGHSECLVIRHNDRYWRNLAAAGQSTDVSVGSMTDQAPAEVDLTEDGAELADVEPMPLRNMPSNEEAGKQSDIKAGASKPTVSKDAMSDSRSTAEPVSLLAKAPKNTPETEISTEDGFDQESYRVQLASFRTEQGAAKGQAILRKLLADKHIELDILVRRAKNISPSAFNYQIRTGPIQTRAEGNGLCDTLKKVGHLGCLVVQHNEQLWKSLAKSEERKNAAVETINSRTKPIDPKAMQEADPVSFVIELPSPHVAEKGHAVSPVPDTVPWRSALPLFNLWL